ncbi:hypothetical protein [Psychrobacillus sp. FJAT-51614]
MKIGLYLSDNQFIEGILLDVKQDHLVVEVNRNILYFSILHIKALSKNAKDFHISEKLVKYLDRNDLTDLLITLRHNWIMINSLSKNALNGVLSSILSDHIILINDKELVYIPKSYISSIYSDISVKDILYLNKKEQLVMQQSYKSKISSRTLKLKGRFVRIMKENTIRKYKMQIIEEKPILIEETQLANAEEQEENENSQQLESLVNEEIIINPSIETEEQQGFNEVVQNLPANGQDEVILEIYSEEHDSDDEPLEMQYTDEDFLLDDHLEDLILIEETGLMNAEEQVENESPQQFESIVNEEIIINPSIETEEQYHFNEEFHTLSVNGQDEELPILDKNMEELDSDDEPLEIQYTEEDLLLEDHQEIKEFNKNLLEETQLVNAEEQVENESSRQLEIIVNEEVIIKQSIKTEEQHHFNEEVHTLPVNGQDEELPLLEKYTEELDSDDKSLEMQMQYTDEDILFDDHQEIEEFNEDLLEETQLANAEEQKENENSQQLEIIVNEEVIMHSNFSIETEEQQHFNEVQNLPINEQDFVTQILEKYTEFHDSDDKPTEFQMQFKDEDFLLDDHQEIKELDADDFIDEQTEADLKEKRVLLTALSNINELSTIAIQKKSSLINEFENLVDLTETISMQPKEYSEENNSVLNKYEPEMNEENPERVISISPIEVKALLEKQYFALMNYAASAVAHNYTNFAINEDSEHWNTNNSTQQNKMVEKQYDSLMRHAAKMYRQIRDYSLEISE